MAEPHLQDGEHGARDGQWQDVVGICHSQVREPQRPAGLHAGNWEVGHLSEGDEEGDEHGHLGDSNQCKRVTMVTAL